MDLGGCGACRWWQMDANSTYRGTDSDDLWRYSHGSCSRIHAGHAADKMARLYPVGSSAWFYTRYDFVCALQELSLAQAKT